METVYFRLNWGKSFLMPTAAIIGSLSKLFNIENKIQKIPDSSEDDL